MSTTTSNKDSDLGTASFSSDENKAKEGDRAAENSMSTPAKDKEIDLGSTEISMSNKAGEEGKASQSSDDLKADEGDGAADNLMSTPAKDKETGLGSTKTSPSSEKGNKTSASKKRATRSSRSSPPTVPESSSLATIQQTKAVIEFLFNPPLPKEAGQLLPICVRNCYSTDGDSLAVPLNQRMVLRCGKAGFSTGLPNHIIPARNPVDSKEPTYCDPCFNWYDDFRKIVPNAVTKSGVKKIVAYQPYTEEDIVKVNLDLKKWRDDLVKKNIQPPLLDIWPTNSYIEKSKTFKIFPEIPECLLELAKKGPVRFKSDDYPGLDWIFIHPLLHQFSCPCGHHTKSLTENGNLQNLKCSHAIITEEQARLDQLKIDTRSQLKAEKKKSKKGSGKKRKKGSENEEAKETPKEEKETPKWRKHIHLEVIPMNTNEQITAFHEIMAIQGLALMGFKVLETLPREVKYVDPVDGNDKTIHYSEIVRSNDGTFRVDETTIRENSNGQKVMVPYHLVTGSNHEDYEEPAVTPVSAILEKKEQQHVERVAKEYYEVREQKKLDNIKKFADTRDRTNENKRAKRSNGKKSNK